MPFWKRRRQESEAPPRAGPQGITFGLTSDTGRVRPSNQDHVFAQLTSLPSWNGQLSFGLFIVADGMGGHTGGALASTLAVQVFAAEVLQSLLMPVLRGEPPEAIQDALRSAILGANRRIMEKASLEGNDMGTTLTAGLVLGERLYVAHVGDSRLYTLDPTGLQRRTRDHSMVARLLELGQITAEQARHHPRKNYLYQSIGQQEEIEAELESFPLEACRRVLICSDGLWGMIEDTEMAAMLSSSDDPQEICDQLVARANAAGGEDNISVVVVAFPGAVTKVEPPAGA